MTTNPYYKEADRIFRMENPTQRQLIRASNIFWGYGVEGDRYTNAERIYDKVKPNERRRVFATATGGVWYRTGP